ncbi:MAG: hypothetical protein AB7S26_39670 [Sandaracinaceae bacterium]
MRFEVHLTLEDGFDDAVVPKCARIELSSGRFPSQRMLTVHVRDEPLGSARALARQYPVRRIKIEAPLSALGGLYIEHHVKVLAQDLVALRELAAEHGAHMSRNPRRILDGGWEERYLTRRFGSGDVLAEARELERLRESLTQQGFEIAKIEREKVLFDDNLSLDAGWSAP